ncbi:MAG: hypothetical protein HKN42_13695 [Granulosicoccus sp.]|nr:hypothetical protein [Granulosicoccus sp.]
MIFAFAEIAYSTTFPALHGQAYGPNLFPILIGCGLALCGLLLIVRGLRARQAANAEEAAWFRWGDWAQDPDRRVNMILIPSVLIIYILLSDIIGFIPLSIILLTLLLYRLGTSVALSILYAVVTTVLLQVLFARVLLVPLPAGITGNLLW